MKHRKGDGCNDDEPPLAYMDLDSVEQLWGKASADAIRKGQRKWNKKHKKGKG